MHDLNRLDNSLPNITSHFEPVVELVSVNDEDKRSRQPISGRKRIFGFFGNTKDSAFTTDKKQAQRRFRGLRARQRLS